MIVLYSFLLCAGISLLFLAEDSTVSRIGVGLLLGLCVLGALLPFVPQEWVEAIPSYQGWGLRRCTNPRALAGALLALAIGYPLAAYVLYPLRDRLMAAFDRRYGKKR